mgnify:CR=1 FL=1
MAKVGKVSVQKGKIQPTQMTQDMEPDEMRRKKGKKMNADLRSGEMLKAKTKKSAKDLRPGQKVKKMC